MVDGGNTYTELATPLSSAMDDEANKFPLIVMSSLPGLLTLSPSRTEALVAREPLHQQYTVENQPFARGKFAAVKRCRNTITGEEFAAKVIRKRRRGAGLTPESLHEAATLDLCRSCPHIVRLEQVYDAPGETVLILQLAEGGELQSVLDRDEIPEEADVIRLLRQVLGGLAYLHQFDIAHLDLKPQNLLLTGAFPNCDIKLCDFGIARHIARGADVREILGTPDYVAPEVLNYEPISLATDMWSVGVLAYVLLTGCTPFGGETKQETFCNITRCQLEFPDDLFQDVSPMAMQFISSLLVQDSSGRLTAQECLDHPWLRIESLVDLTPSFLSYREDSSTFSSNSTIVPEDDESIVAEDETDSTFQETLEDAVIDSKDDLKSRKSNPISNVSSSVTTALPESASEVLSVAPKRMESNKLRLSALVEEPASNVACIARRGGSLPFRWRASGIGVRREASCDGASDMGYGSDGISEVSSADSSSDRSSIISLDESPLEWAQTAMRRYSDTSLAAERLWRRAWERFLPSTAGTCVSLPYRLYRQGSQDREDRNESITPCTDSCEQDPYRPWEKICTGSRARAMERFNSTPPPSSIEQSTSSQTTLNSTAIRPTPVKVSEVRTRLLRGPTTVTRTPTLPSKAPLAHLDKTEIVKARLVKFRSAVNTHASASS